MIVNRQSKIKTIDKVAQRLFEERMLVITPQDSTLHRFNEVGTFIWQTLENPKTIEEIISRVSDHFDCDEKDQVDRDVVKFIDKLARKKVVEVIA
jgi:hypothetical protein